MQYTSRTKTKMKWVIFCSFKWCFEFCMQKTFCYIADLNVFNKCNLQIKCSVHWVFKLKCTFHKYKKVTELKSTINALGLTDLHRVFHPSMTESFFFSVAHEIFSKTDHKLGHKVTVSKYKKEKKGNRDHRLHSIRS